MKLRSDIISWIIKITCLSVIASHAYCMLNPDAHRSLPSRESQIERSDQNEPLQLMPDILAHIFSYLNPTDLEAARSIRAIRTMPNSRLHALLRNNTLNYGFIIRQAEARLNSRAVRDLSENPNFERFRGLRLELLEDHIRTSQVMHHGIYLLDVRGGLRFGNNFEVAGQRFLVGIHHFGRLDHDLPQQDREAVTNYVDAFGVLGPVNPGMHILPAPGRYRTIVYTRQFRPNGPNNPLQLVDMQIHSRLENDTDFRPAIVAFSGLDNYALYRISGLGNELTNDLIRYGQGHLQGQCPIDFVDLSTLLEYITQYLTLSITCQENPLPIWRPPPRS